jgi:xanthine dehydrogenase YagS FAD-binding subunit
MQPFTLDRPEQKAQVLAAGRSGATYMAGGTDLMQLWKNDVEGAARVVDLQPMGMREIEAGPQGLRLGAMATMAEVAEHPAVVRGWPAVSRALLLSASPQVRNMGTMGGNLLQRTRCPYFRNTAFACNKRAPGSGCPAIAGDNRGLGVVGITEHCIATHPSDMPVALRALDAQVELHGTDGVRAIPLGELYKPWGDTPNDETTLRPGEMVAAILVPASAAARRSTYVKVRDRTTFAYALCSAAVGIEVEGGVVRDVRVACGGVGPAPWRLPQVEAAMRGRTLDAALIERASALASDGATAQSRNGYKLLLMQRTVRRALQDLTA